jgi:hypothetical protein
LELIAGIGKKTRIETPVYYNEYLKEAKSQGKCKTVVWISRKINGRHKDMKTRGTSFWLFPPIFL